LALGSQLWEVEGGEGGVGVYGTDYDVCTLLYQPHSQTILTASFDCLEYSKTWGRRADGALKESYLGATAYTCFKLVRPGQRSVAPTDLNRM